MYAPEAINSQWRDFDWDWITDNINAYACVNACVSIYIIRGLDASHFRFMALVIDGRDPSKDVRRQLQPKKAKERLYQPFIWQQKMFYPLTKIAR